MTSDLSDLGHFRIPRKMNDIASCYRSTTLRVARRPPEQGRKKSAADREKTPHRGAHSRDFSRAVLIVVRLSIKSPKWPS